MAATPPTTFFSAKKGTVLKCKFFIQKNLIFVISLKENIMFILRRQIIGLPTSFAFRLKFFVIFP